MCLSVPWAIATFLWVIGFVVFVAIVYLLVPWVLRQLEIADPGPLMKILKLVIAFIALCWVCWFLYDLYVCSFYGGGAYPYRARP